MFRLIRFVVSLLLLACIGCCALVWFVGIPRARNQATDDITNALSSAVAGKIGRAAAPGTYTIDADSIQSQIQLQANSDSSQINNLIFTVEPQDFELGFSSSSQTFGYTGQLDAMDGRLVVENLTASNSLMTHFISNARIASAIEDGVNGYLEANNLVLTSVTMGDGKITFVVDSAS